MNSLLQDLRYGARMLLKKPGFTLIAVITLALGIGANTAIFSVVNTLLFKPLPYHEPDRLVQLYHMGNLARSNPGGMPIWSYPEYEALRANHQSFESVAGFEGGDVNLTGTDEPERLACEYVSASYFPTLGVNVAVGRVFLPEEDSTPGTHPVVMIGYGLWQRRFGADPNIVGKSLSLNKNSFTVVGVLPAGFRGQSGTAEVWLPTMIIPQMAHPGRLGEADNYWLGIIARLKANVTLVQAQAEMEVVAGKVVAALPPPGQPVPGVRPPPTRTREIGVRLVGLKEARINPTLKKSFLILLAAVGLVLLIACVNTANLLLTRAVARRKEIAVRLALGAGRGRLVRQFLTESVLLALLGGGAGLLVAVWGIELLTSFKLESAPDIWASYSDMLKFYTVHLDSQVLLFNLLLSLVTGFIFGLVPALQASRPDLNAALKEGTTGAPESFGRWRRLNARGVLVVLQITLSFVLLAGAGLMMRSLTRLAAVNLGFKPQDITILSVYARDARPEIYQQLRESVAALPGVEAASIGSRAPLLGYSSTVLMQIDGRELAAPDGDSSVGLHSVSPEYFQTLSIPLIKGRAFTSADRAGRQRVALINETTARKFWPGADPLGQRIRLSINLEPSDAWAEIVGIVGDVKYGRIEDAHRADVYFSSLQPTGPTATLIVRSKIDQTALVSAMRREVAAVDRNIPVYGVRTMNERIAEVNGRTRFITFLLALFAGLALTLAGIGIYGVMSYAVSARTREIGIRLALGAQGGDVVALMLRRGTAMILVGVVSGAAAALAATRVLEAQLFGVVATDGVTFASVSLLLAGVALMACWIPAWRATKVDPLIALRSE
jgi:putative ABC transport system permease protein